MNWAIRTANDIFMSHLITSLKINTCFGGLNHIELCFRHSFQLKHNWLFLRINAYQLTFIMYLKIKLTPVRLTLGNNKVAIRMKQNNWLFWPEEWYRLTFITYFYNIFGFYFCNWVSIPFFAKGSAAIYFVSIFWQKTCTLSFVVGCC